MTLIVCPRSFRVHQSEDKKQTAIKCNRKCAYKPYRQVATGNICIAQVIMMNKLLAGA